MSRPGTTLSSQKLEYDEVIWASETRYGNAFAVQSAARGYLQPLPQLGTVTNVTAAPSGLSTGMSADSSRPPYWVFAYKIDRTKGLVITDIKVKDTVGEGSIEEVFEKIEFSDLKIFFEGGTTVNFDLAAALSSTTGTLVWLTIGENGAGRNASGSYAAPRDALYQRGLKLEIMTNVLSPSGGTCQISLVFSIVFRGSKNDFDPGGVPVAMIAWPQYSFRWSNEIASRRVVKFIGSIKISMINKMHSSHTHHGPSYNENIAGLFTDSNTSIRDATILRLVSPRQLVSRANYYVGLTSRLGSNVRQPFGWALVFDYVNKLRLNYNSSNHGVTQSETETVAVYGYDDESKYSNFREKRYEWIPGMLSPGIRVRKAPRQGMYDNMHNHARMSSVDINGNIQIHAPFCGHSCIHTHWRWSNISSWGFISDTPKYKGWGASGAHTQHDAPKVPPNQKVRIAICNTTANSGNGGNSYSDSNILNPQSLGNLDPLRKMFWYRAEIIRPNANEDQVVMEQGIGWAFRYAMPSWLSTPLTPGIGGESDAVDGLTDVLPDSLPWTSAPTQDAVSDFFENSVYPAFRYKDTQDQVPEGNHDTLYSGGTGTSMEDL